MKKRFYAALLGVLAASSGLGGTVRAQPVPNVPVVEAQEIDTPLNIDPVAKKALQELVTRYQKLHSYSDVTTLEKKNGVDWVAKIAWERPNKAVVMRQKNSALWGSVSDGTTLWAVEPEHAGYCLKRPTEADRFDMAFAETGTSGPGTGLIQGDYNFDQMEKAGLRVLRFQGAQEVDGTLTRLISAKLESAEGGTEVLTLYIGIEDGLLYQAVDDYTVNGRTMHQLEKHTEIRLNPALPPDTWHFSPPANLNVVSEFPNLEPHRFDLLYKVGDPLPSFESTGLDGKKISLDDIADGKKLVILHFFTTGDGAEVENLNRLLETYGKQGLAVVGISMDGRRSAVEKFVEDNHIAYPIVFDGKSWDGVAAAKYGVRSLPRLMLVSDASRLLLAGERPSGTEFDAILAQSLGVPAPDAPQ